MNERLREVPESQVSIESVKARITRRYVLPLVITFSLGLAVTAITAEVYWVANWDQVAEAAHKPDEKVDDLNDGKWPDAPDVGVLTVAEGGLIFAAGAIIGKRKLDKAVSTNLAK